MKEELTLLEARRRLDAIKGMCDRALTSGRPMLNYDVDLLRQIKSTASCTDELVTKISDQVLQQQEHVIISCDALIQRCSMAIGAVIEYKSEPAIDCSRVVKHSTTLKQGKYDAIYLSLTQLMAIKHNPGCMVEIRLDDLEIVEHLNSQREVTSEKLNQKKENLLQLIENIPVPVVIDWWPKNSTSALRRAGYLAHTLLQQTFNP